MFPLRGGGATTAWQDGRRHVSDRRGWRRRSASSPPRRQRRVLDADALNQENQVEQGKDQGDPPGPEDQGQDGDLRRHDKIIGMPEITIGAPAHQGRPRQNNDPGGPEPTEARQHPQARRLQGQKQGQQGPVDGRLGRDQKQEGEQPCRVQPNDQRIMAGADFMPTLGQQASGVAP